MSILVYKDKAIAGAAASTMLAAQIIEKPASVIGFDYTSDLAPVYRALVRMTDDGLLEWSDVRAFILSEQVREDADRSIYQLLCSTLLDKVEQKLENRFVPDMTKGDWSMICNDFENAILIAGGLDMAFVSIRPDGSIVYNYGAPELAPVTHVERTEQGRIVTVGITTLMAAKKLVVFMTGDNKADIAPAIFHGPIVPTMPASYLQLHGNAVFILDEEAAANL